MAIGEISSGGTIIGGMIGQRGAPGVGIKNIQKTSTQDLVDTYTITYTNNATSTFDVTNGAKGDTGATGATGTSITNVSYTSSSGLVDTYTITFSNGSTSTFTITNGTGVSGISYTSSSGLVDTYTISYTDGSSSTFTITNGTTYTPSVDASGNLSWSNDGGKVNPTTRNIKGQKGDKGDTGEKGEQGIQGEQGEQGIQGETGATGNGIDGIEKTSTSGLVDTYTITYDNGDTDTFDVTNGADGNVTDVQVEGTSVVDNGVANITGLATQTELDKYKMLENALPKVTGTGESITLEDTAKCPMKMGFKGQIQQDSTTGKNLLPYNTLTTTTENGITFTPVFEGNNLLYIRAKGTASANTTYRFYGINTTTPQKTFNSATKINFGLTGSSSTYGIVVWGLNSGGTDIGTVIYNDTEYATGFQLAGIGLRVYSGANVDIQFKPMIRLSSITDDTYEPYTNGASPNPTYPQDIHTCSGDNTIKVEGKNLFDKNNLTANYRLDSVGLPYSNSGYSLTDFIPVKPSTTYCRNYSMSAMEALALYDKNKVFISRITSGQAFATTSETYYIRTDVTTAHIDTTQLEIGSQITTFEEYQEQTYPINLPNGIELCKIGTYQDYIYKDNGKWYLHKEIGKVVLDGSEGWTASSLSVTGYKSYYKTFTGVTDNTNGISNYFRKGTSTEWSSLLADNFFEFATNTIGFRIIETLAPTLADFKTWLSTNNVDVYYILATPTNTEIADTTLISQLENTLYSYTGQTNISQENNDEPFIIKATALYDLTDLVNRVATFETE